MVESERRKVAVCVLRSDNVHFAGVLVLAGIELIFFLVASIVLWFGFRMTIMLITH